MSQLLQFVTYPMELGLVWLALAVGSAGIGIILFTVFVRLILTPFQIAQLRNAKSMQRLQPLMAELRQKHGKDKQKMTEATMALYKEHQVNPAMGCLLSVVQLPILLGLFYGLMHLGIAPPGYPGVIHWAQQSACNGHPIHGWSAWYQYCYGVKNMPGTAQRVFELFHAHFLWLSNGLGKPDPLYILPVLAGVTQWIQSRMMLTRSTDPQQQMMNSMMNFMPLMIVFFATRYASGLSLYWVTSTTIGILISYPITGWGLLPVPWGKGKTPARSGGKAVRPAPSSKNGPSNKSKEQPSTSVASAATETEPDGQNGASGQKAAPVTRPRKKANRARGGRGGGRRG